MLDSHSRNGEQGPRGLFLGLCTLDIVYRVTRLPEPDEKLAPLDQWVVAGGPATNAAVTFSHLGGQSRLATALGHHHVSGLARDELESWGVQLIGLETDDGFHLPLVTVMVQETTGQRSILSSGAKGRRPRPEELDPAWLDGAQVLLIDGHLMEISIAAARLGRQRNLPVVLDAGSWKSGMEKLLPFVDHVICSETFRPPGCRSIAEVFEYLRAAQVPEVAVTRGPRPVLYAAPGRLQEIAVPRVTAVDTLAAGDIFHGAYAFQVALGRPVIEALGSAAEIASLSCATFGPRQWMVDRPTPAGATPKAAPGTPTPEPLLETRT